MRGRQEIGRMVREEVAEHRDDTAAEVARRQIREDEEADEINRAARARRGTPVPDKER